MNKPILQFAPAIVILASSPGTATGQTLGSESTAHKTAKVWTFNSYAALENAIAAIEEK